MGSIFLHPILQRKETRSLVCSRTVGNPYFGSKNRNPPETSLFAAALHSVATTYPSLQTRYGRACASPVLRTSAYRTGTCWPDAVENVEKQATDVAGARGLSRGACVGFPCENRGRPAVGWMDFAKIRTNNIIGSQLTEKYLLHRSPII